MNKLNKAGAGAVYSLASVPAGTYGALTVSSSIASSFGTSIDMAVNQTTNRSNYVIGAPSIIENLVEPAGGGTGQFTIMAWINPDVTVLPDGNPSQRIFGTGVGGISGWSFGTVGTTLRITTNGRTNNAVEANLQVDTWYHVAATYSDNTLEFFLNGNSIGTDSDAGGFIDETANNYRFGATSNGGEQFMGDMDELKIFDNVLTLSEIQAAAVAVPEPSSTALLGLGGLALILRRRK